MLNANTLTLLCVLGVSVVQPAFGQDKQAEFARLHKDLTAAKEPWQSIPWHVSLLDARAQAGKEGKPIYMLSRAGHPLGCVWNNGIADRASVFQDVELVKVLSTKFVPVAVDQHIHRQKKDAEGELFAKVLKQANRGLDGYSQGVYLFTADGKLLAFANTADAAGVRRLTEVALRKFDPMAAPIQFDDAKSSPVLPPPPNGGLVLDVTAKVLGGYDKADKRSAHHINSLGRDHLWLRKDETDALIKGTLPDSVTQRLVRYHLIDNTRGEPPMWRVDEIKKLDLTLKAGKLAGSIHLETKTGERGYQADFLGVLETKDGKMTRFDLLAKGQFWGEGTFSRGAPKGRFPFAVAFSLADADCAASKVPPQGARGKLKAYLK